MIEYSTKALVLDANNVNELDKLVLSIYGRIGQGGCQGQKRQKITSKLAAYLEPLNFIRIRLVEKNGFQIVDALNFDKITVSPQNLAISRFIKEMPYDP